MFSQTFLYILTLFLITFKNFTNCQNSTTLNVLLFYQRDDAEAVTAFEMAVKYVNEKLKIKIGNIYKVESYDENDSNKLMEYLCEKVDAALSNASNPDVVVDLTKGELPSEAVKVITRSLQLPTVSGTFGQDGDIREWKGAANSSHFKYLIQVAPPADVLVQVVRSIVDLQNMTSAVLMFDKTQYDMYHKYKSLLQNMPTRHLLTKIESEPPAIRTQIDKLVHVDICNFFIAAKSSHVTGIMSEASTFTEERDGPFFSDEYSWYSMTLEIDAPEPRCNGCNISASLVHMTPELSKSSERYNELGSKNKTLTLLFYYDLTINALISAGKLKQEGKWPDLKGRSCSKYTENVTNIPPFDVDYFAAFKAEGSENIIPFNLFGPGVGVNYANITMLIKRLTFTPNDSIAKTSTRIGLWRGGFHDEDAQKQIEFYLGKNLENHLALTVFRIVTVIQPPFVYEKKNCEHNKSDKYDHHCLEGLCISLLEKIEEDLKLNYTIKVMNSYGYMGIDMDENGEHVWDGMVKELNDRKADIALGAMSVMAERETVVDFTVPFYDLAGLAILMKRPKQATSLFKFMTVLENDVWMCILGAYFFTSILLWIYDRWSPYSYQNNREKYEDDDEKREFNLKECLWFCMTSLTPQGGGEAPKSLSGRLAAGTWWLFGFIIIASYTANLAAFLTVSRLDSPVDSLDGLIRQYKIQYSTVENSSAWIYFERMKNVEERFYNIWKEMSLNSSIQDFERSMLSVWEYPVSEKYLKIWEAIKINEPPKSYEAAVERVRGKPNEDAFAFIGDATDIRYEELTSCDLVLVGEEFSRKPYSLAVQQGSPLKDQLNDAILKLLNSRDLEQLKDNWWGKNPYRANCPKEEDQSDGISIHNIGGVFIVIFIGIILACISLVIEYWWTKKKEREAAEREMRIPQMKEFSSTFNSTNFNTEYSKTIPLPTIQESW